MTRIVKHFWPEMNSCGFKTMTIQCTLIWFQEMILRKGFSEKWNDFEFSLLLRRKSMTAYICPASAASWPSRAAPVPCLTCANLASYWASLPHGGASSRHPLQTLPHARQARATSASCWASLPHGGANSRHLCLMVARARATFALWWREVAPPLPHAGQPCPTVARPRATFASCWASLPG